MKFLLQPSFTEHILFHDTSSCPLGNLYLIVNVKDAPGVVPVRPMRIYGAYATVSITRGQGSYRDANGVEQRVTAGDIIFVFPELPHVYAPDPKTTWDEIYTVFDGPVFDFLRSTGLLDSRRPVRRGPPIDYWVERLKYIADSGNAELPTGRTIRIVRFLELLTEILGSESGAVPSEAATQWASNACRLLASDLGSNLRVENISQRMNMGADQFRRKFKREVGMTPVDYRMQKKIEAACRLLSSTTMTHAQIAERLGFSDEYHFSKSFRLYCSEPPRDFRRRTAATNLAPDN